MGRYVFRSELVERSGVTAEDFSTLDLGQRRLEGIARIVKIPMRIVRREQQPVDADPFDQLPKMPGFVRLVDRLRREPEMLLHIFRRPPFEMRHLGAEALKMLVHPPHGRGDPAKAAFDEHDLELWKTLRDAFDDQARQLRRDRMGVALVLLAIIRRPAAAGRRMSAIAADVDAERQAEFLGTRIDRPVAAAAERLIGAWANVDLQILADFRAAIDLG